MRREPADSVRANDAAWDAKMPWASLHQECYRFGRTGYDPYRVAGGALRGGARGGRSARGTWMHEDVFDGTLGISLTKTANRIMSEVFPPGEHWLHFQPAAQMARSPSAKEDRTRLQAMREVVFTALHASNGDQAIHEVLIDGLCSGTGVIRVGGSTDAGAPLDLDSTSQTEVALEAGPRGNIWGYHRQMDLPRDHILALWPDAEPPPEDEGHPTEQMGMPRLHTVYESTYYDRESGWWYYDVLAHRGQGGQGEPTVLLQERYPVSRWAAWRWARMPGEVYGRSPVMDALPDARTASELVGTLLQTASMRVAGIFTYVHDGVINPNTVRMRSGALIQVGSNSNDNPTMRPLEVGGDIDLGTLVLEDQRMAIRQAMLDIGLPDETRGVRSATEINARLKEMYQQIGSPFARLVTEFARPLIQCIVYVLQEQGRLDFVKAERGADGRPAMIQLDKGEEGDVDVVFTSPLVQSQRLAEVQSLVQGAEIAQVAAGPEAYQAAVKAPRVAARVCELVGWEEDLFRSKDEAEQMYTEARQAALQAAQPPQPQGGMPDAPAGVAPAAG